MKKTTAMMLMAGALAAGTCHAGLQTVFYDDFSSGNLNAWSGTGTTGNAVISYAGNNVLDVKVGSALYHDFPGQYITNPDGPEWRLSFLIRSPDWAGASYSYVKTYMGTATNPVEYGWWLGDAPGTLWGDKSNSTLVNDNHETGWGTDAITGIPDTGWYTVTMTWEQSTSTLSALIADANGTTVASNSIVNGSFDQFNRLTLGASLNSGKEFYLDDVKVEMSIPEPASLGLLVLGGLVLARRRR